MKSLPAKILYFALPTLVVIGAIFLSASKDNTKPQPDLSRLAEQATIVSLDPPADLNFAGEIAPLREVDVNERFEKQLVKNVYFHSSTILILKRANRWKKQMKDILKANGIPEDFFYLCIAESHLTNATSPVGAKGFWQFMPVTAKQFGLEVSKQVDERKDPIKSTYAACKYLNMSFKKFDNWTLVAASYNMGMYGVEKALAKQQVNSYYDLYLNSETSAYIFRILALKTIMQDAAKYGFNMEDDALYQPIAYRNIKVEKSIPSLIDFALAEGTNYKNMRIMNPWLLRESLTVRKGESYTLKVPLDAESIEGEETFSDSTTTETAE